MLHLLFSLLFFNASAHYLNKIDGSMEYRGGLDEFVPRTENLAHYHTTQQDHFNDSNTRTWSQAYYVNDTYYKPNGPVFLCVGGEGPALTANAVRSSVHCNIAAEWLQETNAMMFALEHRYYGCHNRSACPYEELRDRNPLQWLSSRQALADLALFHSHATDKYQLPSDAKWISWGGSYPGMLAGWSRVVYPNLIHAAVSSSAPVIAKLDMRGYNDVVADAYKVAMVGGSDKCSEAIREGHAMIGELMDSEAGRSELELLFHVDGKTLETQQGKLDFAGFGVAYFPAQGNDPACTDPACNIAHICSIMVNEDLGNEVTRLAKVKESQASWSSAEWEDYWTYQTCTEFGFYQTCEVGSNCFFTQGLDTLSTMDGDCVEKWGISAAEIQKSIDRTNAFYGADNPKATRILYPNGEVDPWHALSKLNSTNPDLPTLWVKGASHHSWTHPSKPTDLESVVKARGVIRDTVRKWLAVED